MYFACVFSELGSVCSTANFSIRLCHISVSVIMNFAIIDSVIVQLE